MGLGGRVEDEAAKGSQDMRDYLNDEAATTTQQMDALPDYTLSGKLLKDQARSGKTRQASYVFQLSLTDTSTGQAVWEEERTITKQGQRSSVGW